MSDASAVVDRATQAVEQADGKTLPSAEVQAQERIEQDNASKAGKKSGTAKATAKPAQKKPGKYTDEVKSIAVKARGHRTKKNAIAPVTVTRVQAALKKAKVQPDAVVRSFATIKDAEAYASGTDKSIKAPQLVANLNEKIEDPFARSRGLVSISLALAGK